MSSGGFVHDSIVLRWNPVAGRGLYTTTALENNTDIIKIPVAIALHNLTIYTEVHYDAPC